MIIEIAKIEDISELKELWKKIFKDSDDYIENFFLHRMKPEYTFVGREDGKIISTAYMLKADLVSESGEIIPSFYMCGISTKEEFRGKGHSKQLIERCFAFARDEGADLCYLVPANKSLFDFYSKSGMIKFTSLSRTEMSAEYGIIPSYTEKFDGKKLLALYSKINAPFKVNRTYEDFEYIHKTYEILIFDNDYVVIEEDEENIYVPEQTFLSDDIAKAIANKRGKKLIVLRPSKDTNEAYTVVKILNSDVKLQKNGYINLNI